MKNKDHLNSNIIKLLLDWMFVHLLTFLEQLNDQYLALLHSQPADGWMIGSSVGIGGS